MAPFSATDKAPGVYIEEIQTPGAIPGVGTSTAAFVGPAEKGPTEPTFLTSYKQFDERFGGPVNGVFAAHAVRGFFENGGTACYFVRVGNGKCASLTLKDRAGNDVLRVTAIQEGA